MPESPLAPQTVYDVGAPIVPEAADRIFVTQASTGESKCVEVGSLGGSATRLEVGLSGDTNDLDPGTASWLRVDCTNTGSKLTGIAGGVDGRRILVTVAQGLSNPWYASQEDSGSVAANRFVFGDMMPGVLMADGDSFGLVYDGDLSRWTCEFYNRASLQHLKEEKGLLGFTLANSGAGSSAVIVPDYYRFRYLTLNTGTTNSGSAGVHNGDLAGFIRDSSVGEAWMLSGPIYLSTPSDGTNRFVMRWGFMSSVSGEPSHGIYMRHVDNVNSGRWQAVCRQGGTETVADLGLAVTGGFFGYFAIISALDHADFYYLDAAADPYRMKFACRIAANLPSGVQPFGYGASIVKTVGTAAREWYPYELILEANGG
jgi:hypothetical protein